MSLQGAPARQLPGRECPQLSGSLTWQMSFSPSLFGIVGFCPPGGVVSPCQVSEAASPSLMDDRKAPGQRYRLQSS